MQKLSIGGSEIWHFMSHIIVPEKNTTFKNAIIFLGLLDQLQIFLQLYLIQLLELLTGLVLLDLRDFIYPRLLTGFYMLVFFTNSSLVKFQVRNLAFSG